MSKKNKLLLASAIFVAVIVAMAGINYKNSQQSSKDTNNTESDTPISDDTESKKDSPKSESKVPGSGNVESASALGEQLAPETVSDEKPTGIDFTSNYGIDELPTQNNGVKSQKLKYESIDTLLSKQKTVQSIPETLPIGGVEGSVAPAVVVGDIEKYRNYSMVKIPKVRVTNTFIDKTSYGQTLVELEVKFSRGVYQYFYFACSDPVELQNQLDTGKYINVVASGKDIFTTNLTLDNGEVVENALVVLGTYSRCL